MATIGNAPVFPTESVLPGNLEVTGNATINGTTNSVGALTENSNNVVNVADTGTITAGMLDGGQTGSQLALACRAFVAFKGTGTVAIRTSKGISSIADSGTGTYQANFSTTFPADYATNITVSKSSGGFSSSNSSFGMLREYLGNTGYVNVYSITSAGAAVDRNYISVSVFF